jgi:putative salt-induced outer membrane protein
MYKSGWYRRVYSANGGSFLHFSGEITMTKATLLLAALLGSATAARAAPIPDAVAAMIDAAAGDAAQLKIVADIAKKTNPQSAAEIDAKVAGITTAAARARDEKLAAQGVFDGWTGSGEIGGSISSGNTNTKALAIGINLNKETRAWKHALRGFVDFQRQDGRTTRERYFAGYEGNYNITPDFYALATLAYEKDRFSGFDRRFSESLGLGYKVINSENIKLAIEGGPALRQTRYTSGIDDSAFAARGAGNLNWTISPALSFTENATIFYDSFNTSVQSITALTAKLGGALSARASFQYNNESNPPAGRKNSDTTSRLTLVYSY